MQSKSENNPTKSAFFQEPVQFLGHVISKKRLEADPEKVEADQDLPIPQNQTDFKSFLGLCPNYRRYIQKFAMMARPLLKASETKGSLLGQKKHKKQLRVQRNTSTPILAFPDVEEPLILYTDASLTTTGAVLALYRTENNELFATHPRHFQNLERTFQKQKENSQR